MKRGSALLIVLGMMAFIMVSALAFSAYMRSARLPSSYLRRTSGARQLAKAALARAITEIDMAIGNDPHPGVGGRGANVWRHRVFMNGSRELDVDSTVSPLCLEALAYMPPPLVNEARYFSRRSATAAWKSLAFDVGRYSYCALDVSDYFDVNRMTAGSHRASSPQARVSLAYLFESDGHTGPGSGADTWDEFLNQFRNFDAENRTVDFKGQYPLVSLADFNLALGKKGGVGVLRSPFYEYLSGGGAGSGFYRTSSDADEDRIRRMTFVTDGLFPPSDTVDAEDVDENDPAANVTRHDLNDSANQPFAADFLATTRPALSDVIMGTRLQNNSTMKWLEHLSGLGCAALYDYLDPDHVPISLAIPTTERVPMICGFQTVLPGAKFSVRKTTDPVDPNTPKVVKGDDVSREVEVKVVYAIEPGAFVAGFAGGKIRTLAVFPFAHPDEKDGSSFNVDGRFSMFFTSEKMKLRTGEVNDLLHLTTPMIGNTVFDAAKGLMNVKLTPQAVGFPNRVETEEQAVKTLDQISLREGTSLAPQLAMADNALLTVTYRWPQTRNNNTGGVSGIGSWTPTFEEVQKQGGKYIAAVHCGMPALKANGTVDEAFKDEQLLTAIQGGGGKPVTLNAAVWLRVIDQQGKIVDMVPACWLDDRWQNTVNDPVFSVGAGGSYAGRMTGLQYPVMRLDTGVEFDLSIEGLEKLVTEPKEIKISPETAFVPDPRFNHAPEHWYRGEDGSLSAETWIRENANNFFNDRSRDGDIFMATSDAGYMQSPFEVAHLTRLTNLIDYENKMWGSFGELGTADREKIGGIGDVKNRNFMWRTYDPFDEDEYAFNILPWKSEGSSFKINPYSDSTNVMMAVFANTPVDWKRASTNAVEGAVDYWDMDADSFNRKYALNEYTSDTQLGWNDLERVAGTFMRNVRQNGGTWKEAFADMNWRFERNSPELFCADSPLNDSDTLWTHDRKFLYGFWRDCFAPKQQLFLVFVRAEPMMMGSGMVGQTPPQLGARAVALVWRDPKRPQNPEAPHRTRVLFYRQFD